MRSDFMFASEFTELRQGLYGSARANELAVIDRKLGSRNLIVADLSNDPTYAEILFAMFGARVIGLHITRSGDGMSCECSAGQEWLHSRLHHRSLLSCSISCTRKCATTRVRILHGATAMQAYEQLDDA